MRRRLRIGTQPWLIAVVVVAILGLFGSAAAARNFINGSRIQPNTITTRQLRNHSVAFNDLRHGVVRRLRGNQGPQGHGARRAKKERLANPVRRVRRARPG